MAVPILLLLIYDNNTMSLKCSGSERSILLGTASKKFFFKVEMKTSYASALISEVDGF